jgi:general stress protein YciG
MSRLPKAARDYMAAIGSKGGKAKGKAKARDPEHYKRLADMKRAKAKKK